MRTRYIRPGIYVNAIPISRICWRAIATVRKGGNGARGDAGAKGMRMQRSMQRPQSARSSSRARASHGRDFVVGRESGVELHEGGTC